MSADIHLSHDIALHVDGETLGRITSKHLARRFEHPRQAPYYDGRAMASTGDLQFADRDTRHMVMGRRKAFAGLFASGRRRGPLTRDELVTFSRAIGNRRERWRDACEMHLIGFATRASPKAPVGRIGLQLQKERADQVHIAFQGCLT